MFMLTGLILVMVMLLLLLLVNLTIQYRWLSSRDRALVYKLPGPPGISSFIGNAAQFLTLKNVDILQFLTKYCKEYYPICTWHCLGNVHVFIQDINEIEKVLNSPLCITKSIAYQFLHPWLRTGLLTSTGSKWHARRKLLTPAFHFKVLEDYMQVFNRNSAILVKKLQKHINDPFIPINKFTTLCTLDIICETAMGTQINSQEGQAVEYVKAVIRMCEIIQIRQMTIFYKKDLVFKLSSLNREQVQMLRTLHAFSKKVIRERRTEYRENRRVAPQKSRYNRRLAFLDLLIELSENEVQLSDADIQEEVDTFIFEGHDTTSSALSWALYLLGAHPDIQDTAFNELDEIFGDSDRPATNEDLHQMRYLEQVIKEALRLYPSVPLIGRKVDTYFELGGYTIPPGCNIEIMTYLVHRNPELFPDPDKFDPDRFLPDAIQGRHPFAYLPFSASQRNCIGQRFALMEEKVVLSTILRNFRLHSLDDDTTIKLLMELVLRPKDPLRIKLSLRKSPTTTK